MHLHNESSITIFDLFSKLDIQLELKLLKQSIVLQCRVEDTLLTDRFSFYIRGSNHFNLNIFVLYLLLQSLKYITKLNLQLELKLVKQRIVLQCRGGKTLHVHIESFITIVELYLQIESPIWFETLKTKYCVALQSQW